MSDDIKYYELKLGFHFDSVKVDIINIGDSIKFLFEYNYLVDTTSLHFLNSDDTFVYRISNYNRNIEKDGEIIFSYPYGTLFNSPQDEVDLVDFYVKNGIIIKIKFSRPCT